MISRFQLAEVTVQQIVEALAVQMIVGKVFLGVCSVFSVGSVLLSERSVTV